MGLQTRWNLVASRGAHHGHGVVAGGVEEVHEGASGLLSLCREGR